MAEGPQPPLEDRTNGVKVPCSTCWTLCSYALLFSLSCLRYVELVEDELLVGAKELNTLTSKKALLWLLSQKFWALMSSLAPSSVLVLRRGKLSPVRGWRVGSRPTFGQTSVRKLAVMSRIRSWRIDGRAPLGQQGTTYQAVSEFACAKTSS